MDGLLTTKSPATISEPEIPKFVPRKRANTASGRENEQFRKKTTEQKIADIDANYVPIADNVQSSENLAEKSFDGSRADRGLYEVGRRDGWVKKKPRIRVHILEGKQFCCSCCQPTRFRVEGTCYNCGHERCPVCML